MCRLALLLALLLASLPAQADRLAPATLRLSTPGEICRAVVAAAERAANIPQALLAAIARVESGRFDPVSNRVSPWPWTINAEGRPGVFETRDQAIAAVRALQAQGVRSVDVGCLQVNLMHHPNAFASLEQAFDPAANAAYAARFLAQLREQHGDWTVAVRHYHSATSEFSGPYQGKVVAAWPEEQRFALATQRAPALANSGRVIAPELARSGAPLPGLLPPPRAHRATPIIVASRPSD